MLYLRSMGFKLLHAWLCCGWSGIHLLLLLVTPPAHWACHNYVSYSIFNSSKTLLHAHGSRSQTGKLYEVKTFKGLHISSAIISSAHWSIVCLQQGPSVPVLRGWSAAQFDDYLAFLTHQLIIKLSWCVRAVWTLALDWNWWPLVCSFKARDMEIADMAWALKTKEGLVYAR